MMLPIFFSLFALTTIVSGFMIDSSPAKLRLSSRTSPGAVRLDQRLSAFDDSGNSIGRDMTFNTAMSAKASSVEAPAKGLKETFQVAGLFGLWYALNIGYNIYNKKVLNMIPNLVYSVAFCQLFVGLVYIMPIWFLGLRKRPELNNEELKTLLPVAALHLGTHLGAIVSLGAGAVSFTHIVKAAEPAASALLSAVVLRQFMPLPVYLSLIPVMGGVAMASLTELSFNKLAFCAAMLSNFASAGRGIVGKLQMGKSTGKNMTPTNLYAVMTILSAAMCLPLSLLLEGSQIAPTLAAVREAGNGQTLLLHTLLSSVFYYLYNEVAFLTLDSVAPVTHALGNTIKRVVIIIASMLAFGTQMSTQGVIGSSIAVCGVMLYSIAKNRFT